MKSVVLQDVLLKKYYLGYNPHRYFYQLWNDETLDVNSSLDETGKISSKEEHIEWEVVLETESFTRELKPEEFIKFEDEDYQITQVSHAPDGSILYYIHKRKVIEDEESKKKAEVDFEKRSSILSERTSKKEENEKKTDECIQDYGCKVEPKIKKWYQLWK